MRRWWVLAMVMTAGVTPGVFSGCFQLYGEKVGVLDTALADPWAANPGSPAEPGNNAFIAQFINEFLYPALAPGPDPDGQNKQQFLNTIYWSIAQFIESQIHVFTPQGWVDVGRPR